MTTVVPLANSELVAVAWLQGASGVTAGQVATTLPSDTATWATNGFVQVGPVVGGSPQLHYALREPVIQVETYALTPSSGKPPWGKAASLMELLVAATFDEARMQATLTLPGSLTARVMTAHFVNEPLRKNDDPSSYACYVADLTLHWISL